MKFDQLVEILLNESTEQSIWQPLLDLIAKAESRPFGYTAVNPNISDKDLPNLTISDVVKKYPKSAVGRYQFKGLLEHAKRAKLSGKDLFSSENQDKMAIVAIEKKRHLSPAYIKKDIVDAAKQLAKEWAGLPMFVIDKDKNIIDKGSYYRDKKGNNVARIPAQELYDVLYNIGNPKPIESEPQTTPPVNTNTVQGITNRVSPINVLTNALPTASTNTPTLPSSSIEEPKHIIYIVKPNDILGRIALKHNTTVKNIMSLNPNIKNSNSIKVGQKIKIPS